MPESPQLRTVGSTPIIDLQGKITLGESSTLVRTATDGLLGQGKSRILLNMAQVTYVDSAGLGAIASCHVKALNAGGGLSLCDVCDRVNELLKLTRLNEKLAIFPDEATALASMSQSMPQTVPGV